MVLFIRYSIVTLLTVLLSGCNTLMPNYQEPEVFLTNLKPLTSQGVEQRFLVGLRIVNPNSTALKISGLSYSLSLQGHKVVSGVTNNIGGIPAYDSTQLELEASANLLGGLRALMALLADTENLEYKLETRLNTGWWPWPVTVVETGTINLNQLSTQ